MGGQAAGSDIPDFTVTEVYELVQDSTDASLLTYVDTGATTISPSVYNANAVSCSNVLKELAYTVNVSEVVPDSASTTAA